MLRRTAARASTMTLAGGLALTAATKAAAQELAVPAGGSVLADGRLDAAEWADAARHRFADGTRLLAKRHGDYLLLAVQAPAPEAFGVDLYLRLPEGLVNLHASAKLAERKALPAAEAGAAARFPDWVWWNQQGWVANTARIGDFQPRLSFLPDEAKEFQIRLDRLGSGTGSAAQPLALRLERHGQATVAWPAEGGWLRLRWS